MRLHVLVYISAQLASMCFVRSVAYTPSWSLPDDDEIDSTHNNYFQDRYIPLTNSNAQSVIHRQRLKQTITLDDVIDETITGRERNIPNIGNNRFNYDYETRRRKNKLDSRRSELYGKGMGGSMGSKRGKGMGMNAGSNSGKGKGSNNTGKGMNMGSKGGKGGVEGALPNFCYEGGGKGKGGKGATGKKQSGKGMKSQKSKVSKSRKDRRLVNDPGLPVTKRATKSKKSPKGHRCNELEFANNFDRRHLYTTSRNILDIAQDIPDISVFVSLLHRYDLSYIFECNGPFTVLIPTNEAFGLLDPITFSDLLLPQNKELVENVILSHIFQGIRLENDFDESDILSLSGSDVLVSTNPLLFNSDAMAVRTDIVGSNGVLHLVNRVFQDNVANVCSSGEYDFDGPTDGQNCNDNILQVACSLPELSIFLTIIDETGLSDIFDCSGPFTMLAPTNEAFYNLDINLDDTEFLMNIILYHILPGFFEIDNFETGSYETLLSGQFVNVTTNPTRFNSVSPINVNVEACNGILHVLDGVLQPDNEITNQPSVSPVPILPTLVPTKSPLATTISPSSTIQPKTLSPTTIAPSPVTSGTISPGPTPPTTNTDTPATIAPSPVANGTISPSPPTTNTGSPMTIAPSPAANVTTLPTNMPTAIVPSDLPSLIPVAISLAPTSLPISTQPVRFPVATISPALTDAPSTSTLQPSPTLNTTAPTPLGSDMPSLSPQLSTTAPTMQMTDAPTESELRVDLNQSFYIAFISDSDVEPTPDEYEQMSAAIVDYYNEFIREALMIRDPTIEFIRIEMYLTDTRHNAGIPDDRFNIYMEYSTAIAFFTPNGLGNLISSDDLLTLLLDGITTDFLLDPVRLQVGTPFQEVIEGFLQTIP